jgi:hypothetical protein
VKGGTASQGRRHASEPPGAALARTADNKWTCARPPKTMARLRGDVRTLEHISRPGSLHQATPRTLPPRGVESDQARLR